MTGWTLDHPERVDLDRVEELVVRVVAGDVTVTAAAGSPYVQLHQLQGAPVELLHEGGRLLVEQGCGQGHGSRTSVSLVLAVPTGCRVQVRTVSAAVTVAGDLGPVAAETVSGNLALTGLRDVSTRTVSGAVEASGLSGRLDLESTSGDVAVAGADTPSVRAHTVSGELTLDVMLEHGGDLALDTVSGDVTLRVPEDTGAEVSIHTTSGRVSSQLPGVRVQSSPGSRGADGVLGDGAGRVRVRTVSGDVALLGQAG